MERRKGREREAVRAPGRASRTGVAASALALGLAVAWLYAPVVGHGLLTWGDPAFAARFADLAGLDAPADPRVLHAIPLLLHVAATLAVLAILRAAAVGALPAAIGAGLFGLHPLAVGTVAWAARTPELLAQTLGLWTLAVGGAAACTPAGAARRAAALVLLALALAVHPIAAAVPLVALALGTGPGQRSFGPAARELAPALALGVAAVAWRLVTGGSDASSPVAAPATEFLVALDAIARRAAHVVAPLGLAPASAAMPVPGIATGAVWARAGAVVVGVVVAMRIRAARTPVAIFVAALLPALVSGGATPAGAADGRSALPDAYLALLGPALALAAVVHRVRAPWVRGIALAAVAALAFAARGQLAYWADDAALAARVVAVSPQDWRGQLLLGDVRAERREYREAIDAYDAAIAARPDAFPPRFRKGEAWLLLAAPDSAEAAFRGAVEVDPTNARARIHWADMLFAVGREPEAAEQIETAYRLDSRDPMVVYNVAMKRVAKEEWDAAEEALEALLALQPGNGSAMRTLERIHLGRAAADSTPVAGPGAADGPAADRSP